MSQPISLNLSSSDKTLLLFGQQTLSFDAGYFEGVRQRVVNDQRNIWMIEVIEDLASYWKDLSKAVPILSGIPGEAWFGRFTYWLRNGEAEDKRASKLPNTILSPLTVIDHLVEYSQVATTPNGWVDLGEATQHGRQPTTETLGFRFGLLSAFAVSGSPTRAQFLHNGAAAIRLAMIVGFLIDAQNIKSQSISLDVKWESEHIASQLNQFVESIPDTYVSVSSDENQATITTSGDTISTVKERLEAIELTPSETELQGRFHSSLHEGDLKALMQFCDIQPKFRLPSASQLAIPTRSNSGGHLVTEGHLHEIALRAILVEHCDWINSFRTAHEMMLTTKGSKLIVFGPERCIPPSLQRTMSAEVAYVSDGGSGF